MDRASSAAAEPVVSVDCENSSDQQVSFEQQQQYMRLALDEAQKSPPRPTNFCVGACLVAHDRVLATGYTLECTGNTHAEQCCFEKLAVSMGCAVAELGWHLPVRTALYTTMEPCNQRSAGNTPCVDRILQLRRRDGRPAIETVYVGVDEPGTFVGINHGRARLQQASIAVVHVPGFTKDILRVATAGHEKSPV